MTQVIHFPGTPITPTVAAPRDEQTAAFQARCFEAYLNRTTSRGLTEAYATKCLESVRALLRWSGKTLTGLLESDYEAWTTYLAKERKLQMSTQRTYQKGVRQVFKYLVARQDLQNEAVRLFGHRIELVAHAENSIVHSIEDEAAGRRPPLSHEQMEQFFRAIDTAIDLAEIERPRAARGLKRDYAVIYTGYVYGLRVSEISALRPDDWRRCPEVPELGRYGMLYVRHGKGANGSGKRTRLVPTTHAGYPEFLEWYLTEVRPLYRPEAKSHEPLFFNERQGGGKLSAASIEKSFKRLIIAAGLDPTVFSPHSLRRAMCQHELMRAPAEMARAKAGHQSTATTLIYGQVPAEHYRQQQARLIQTQLQDLKARKCRD